MKRLLLACVALLAASSFQGRVTIDHFLLGIHDLDRGIAEFERRTGVRPVFGGVHPGRGTRNALASLGPGIYIEVIALDPKQTVSSMMVNELTPLDSLKVIGWAAGSTDLAALRQRALAANLRAGPVMPGSRTREDGLRLEWATMNIQSPAHTWLPFFIQWGAGTAHPASTSPGGCSLVSAEIEDPAPEPLQNVSTALGLPVPSKRGSESRMTVTLKCPKGAVTFR